MPEVITIGETMASFTPKSAGLIRYKRNLAMRIAGAESNFAIGISKLGHTCGWLSRLGDDEFGHYVLNSVRAEGVDCSQVVLTAEQPTGIMFKQYAGNGETSVFYYREQSAAANMTVECLQKEYLRTAKYIHLTGITPLLSDKCNALVEEIFAFAKNENIGISFDPNIRFKLCKEPSSLLLIKQYLLQADVVMLGIPEAQVLFQTGEPEEICEHIFTAGKASFIAIKNGTDGAMVADRTNRVRIMPYPCNPVESTGAGDAFNAAFLCGILEGRNLETSGRMGAIAGAMATESIGDIEGMPSKKQMDKVLDGKIEIYR